MSKALRQFNITGMSCAVCQKRVEDAVSSISGVDYCSVSLLTNSMQVKGIASNEAIIKAVVDAGYEANIKEDNIISSDEKERVALRKRFLISVLFLVFLMYFSMGHHMLNLPMPIFFENNMLYIGIFQMILSFVIIIINKKFFISGFKSALNKSPNMDTLVALGSSASFIWSVYALYTNRYDELYFDSAAMILVLITIGKMLEARSKGKTTNALKALIKLSPKNAIIIENDIEKNVFIEDVKKGDIFIVKPGESVPVDGVVLDGYTAINESSLTGESIPVDKNIGDKVYASTINQSGYIKCKAVCISKDTVFAKVLKMVEEASTSKAPIAKVADKVSGVFVPVVISIAVVTFIVWIILKRPVDFSLARAISVLVISCPCALGLATPVAIMVGNGVGARHGILFKNATALEQAGKTNIVVFDKTGTITKGEPEVTDIMVASDANKKELLQYAYSLEKMSEHPLGNAIVKEAEKQNIKSIDAIDFKALPGHGIEAIINGSKICGGSFKYISSIVNIEESTIKIIEDFSNDAKTPLLFSKDKKLMGVIAVADTIKEDSKDAIKELKDMNIKVVMLTGDNEKTAKAIGKEINVDNVISNVLPSEKEKVIKELKKEGKVMMVGDGINDAPALASADISMAIGKGTDIAIDSSEIVLVNSRLIDVPAAIRLSKNTLKNIYENLFFAFVYNVVGIPLAAGCFISFGFKLNPMFGAACMSLSSFLVVSNALRLNLCKIYIKRLL